MPSIRKTKTASGSTAVQVVRYKQRRVVVLKHLGSGKTSGEVDALVASAQLWIEEYNKQPPLFSRRSQRVLPISTTQYLGVTYTFARDVLLRVAQICGFDPKQNDLLLDLAIMRLVEPASKLRSLELLNRYFNIRYSRRDLYRKLPELLKQKNDLEDAAVACAKDVLSSDLALVLYDVTTLYFETFTSDELRVQGFSKDNKPQQPQIVIGLLVTRQGFPLSYEVFAGNTFEGKTMLPVLASFAKRRDVQTPTVVADAAMLSQKNIAELTRNNFSYIVGARMANLSLDLIKQVSGELNQRDGALIRVPTPRGDLVASFSKKRYRKNKGDMDRQITRGQKLVEQNEPGRRAKFVTKDNGDSYVLNQELINKTKQLLGIRGYYTNIPEDTLSNEDVVTRYHDLWRVESAFRMAKSDLASRPIFHYTEDAVRVHILICFVALVLGKYIEIKTGVSTRLLRDMLWSISEAHMVDTVTGETFVFRSSPSKEVEEFLQQLGVSY